MVVVAIDTSQRVGGVALGCDGKLVDEASFGAEASHLVELGAALESMLRRHGLANTDIERVALVSGPGSFTGLRIGMAFAKGLHAGLGVEIVTIGTLELLALPHLGGSASVCPMLDARKGEVYAAVFAPPTGGYATPPPAGATTVVPPCAMTAARFLESLAAAPALLLGSGVVRYREDVGRLAPRAALADPLDAPVPVGYLARIAHRLPALAPAVVRNLEPDYLRSSEAELKRLRETRP